MNIPRRQFFRAFGALGLGTLFGLRSRAPVTAHEGTVHSASAVTLEPFVDALRIPPVLKPKVIRKVDTYTMTMRAALAQCHRDLPPTPIWGYNGIFPGPTIVAKKGRAVSVRQINELPVCPPAPGHEHPGAMLPAVHLHGADVRPDSDGHPRDGIPFYGGFRDYQYPNQQRGCALYYHDHTHEMTGHRVAMGLSGMYLLVDKSTEAKLRLPSGKREIPLNLQDRSFNALGEFQYSLTPDTLEMGFHGDMLLVNGVVQPYLQVETAKYRFRILNGSNARIYKLALSDGSSLIQIGTDGGLLQRPKPQASIEIAPSERIDVIIDFSAAPVGSQIILQNLNGAGSTGSIMRFDVTKKVRDTKKIPAVLLPWEEIPEDQSVGLREFRLARQTVDGVLTWTINGQAYRMDNPPLATPTLGTIEHWKFINPSNHPHPMHLHLVQFQVVAVNGEPQEASDYGWKDTVVVPPASELTIVVRFLSHLGRYVFHCHNLEHEDFAMMAEFEVIAPTTP